MVDKFTDPLPFIAVVETYVLRSLRDFGLTKHIRMSRRLSSAPASAGGAPIVQATKVPVDAVLDLRLAGNRWRPSRRSTV